jgi:hypothetical protein
MINTETTYTGDGPVVLHVLVGADGHISVAMQPKDASRPFAHAFSISEQPNAPIEITSCDKFNLRISASGSSMYRLYT